MKNNLFIPKQITVGYQERDDTYTGKLSYIIYTDNKGVLRKEKSWQSWRKEHLGRDDIENIPTEGFVLNKGVGGRRESYGWNARNEYIRVYDPRGFEFEISVANLLFILQETNSIKGKGLEGEFIYCWEGKELILLPVSAKEYKECVDFTNLQDQSIASLRDLQIGHLYLSKKMDDLVYLGRFKYLEQNYSYKKGGHYIDDKKKHIFYDIENDEFKTLSNTKSLAIDKSKECVYNYAEILDMYNNTKHSSKAVEIVYTDLDLSTKTIEEFCDYNFIIKYNDKCSSIYDYREYNDVKEFQICSFNNYIVEDGFLVNSYNREEYKQDYFNYDELLELDIKEFKIRLENGNLVSKKEYER